MRKLYFVLADHHLSRAVRRRKCSVKPLHRNLLLPKAGNFRLFRICGGLSLDGRIGVGDRSADVNASFRNILDHLHFTLMGMGDATWNNKIVLLTDAAVFGPPRLSRDPWPAVSGCQSESEIIPSYSGGRLPHPRRAQGVSGYRRGHSVLASDDGPAISIGVTSGH